jgi:hypothetical protein
VRSLHENLHYPTIRLNRQTLIAEVSPLIRYLESKENGLLPGRILVLGEYLGCEVFMADKDRSLWREHLYGANDSVCSGSSNSVSNRRSGDKPWTYRQHCSSRM